MHSERLSSMQQLPMAMLMQLVIIADLVLLLWPWNQLHSPPESSRNALLQLQKRKWVAVETRGHRCLLDEAPSQWSLSYIQATSINGRSAVTAGRVGQQGHVLLGFFWSRRHFISVHIGTELLYNLT